MTQTSKTCKHRDCGWCYAPDDSPSNDTHGECTSPDTCEELKLHHLEDDDGNL